jgi:2-polyprenyl-3-methyl-5-hydroxy-6-metoxy-1,4-benzoquinol methylase
MSDIQELLEEQARYYRARAGEYEDWWFRRGRYDHGSEVNARWFADVSEVQDALERFVPTGDILELACGTGLWTRRLAPHARSLTAIDASPEALELARSAVNDTRVSYIQADLFEWEPDRTYDVCFFGFWLSHVPEERFHSFWEKVKRAVVPSGRVFFVDSTRNDRASAKDHTLPSPDEQTMTRRLADGREFSIVKRFHEPQVLEHELAGVGWSADIKTTSEFFVYGHAKPLT